MLHLTLDIDARNYQGPKFGAMTKTRPLPASPDQADDPAVRINVKSLKHVRADHGPSFHAGQQVRGTSI
jgi:hypothetical protein